MKNVYVLVILLATVLFGCINQNSQVPNNNLLSLDQFSELKGYEYYCIGNLDEPEIEVKNQMPFNGYPRAVHVFYPNEITEKNQSTIPLFKNHITNESWYAVNCSNFSRNYSSKILVGQTVQGGACDKLDYEIERNDNLKTITTNFIYDQADPETVCTLQIVYHQKWVAINKIGGYEYKTTFTRKD